MKTMLITLTTLLLAAGAAHGQAPATTQPIRDERGASRLAEEDANFIREVAQSNAAEIEMGHLLMQKGQNQEVKDYGRRLVSDHTESNQQLARIAATKGIDLPTTAGETERAHLQHLSSQEGAAFDRMAREHAVSDHQKTIDKFQQALQKLQDNELKSFAQQQLPILQQHLQAAQRLTAGQMQQQGR